MHTWKTWKVIGANMAMQAQINQPALAYFIVINHSVYKYASKTIQQC
jgi:hypothetical protein